MTNGERKTLHHDFAQTFAGETLITDKNLVDWATNTQAFYQWFYTRFEKSALKAVKEKRFHKYSRDYKPMFMEWCAWEIIPCSYADFLRGCVNAANMKTESMAEYDAAREIFQRYVQIFKETHKIA